MQEKCGVCPRGFFLNAERLGGGMRLSVGGVVSVSELTDERIVLVTHASGIEVTGRALLLSAFDQRCVEIVGRVLEVRLLYGKN